MLFNYSAARAKCRRHNGLGENFTVTEDNGKRRYFPRDTLEFRHMTCQMVSLMPHYITIYRHASYARDDAAYEQVARSAYMPTLITAKAQYNFRRHDEKCTSSAFIQFYLFCARMSHNLRIAIDAGNLRSTVLSDFNARNRCRRALYYHVIFHLTLTRVYAGIARHEQRHE